MLLAEYLKTREIREKSLTRKEAAAVGIPWPLVKGWAVSYGGLEINEAQLVVMREALARLRRKTHPETNPPLPASTEPGLSKKQRRVENRKLRKERRLAAKEARNAFINATIQQSITITDVVSTVVKTPVKRAQMPPEPKAKWAYDGFYETREWRELRYKALVKNGAKCQCCGASRSDGVRIHVDHIKPRSKFPELQLELTNLQILCEDCNLGKSNKDCTDWR